MASSGIWEHINQPEKKRKLNGLVLALQCHDILPQHNHVKSPQAHEVLVLKYKTKVIVLGLEFSYKTGYLHLYSWYDHVIVLGPEYKKMYLNSSLLHIHTHTYV